MMENVTNTYCNSKPTKPKQVAQLQYSSNINDFKDSSLKQSSSRYSSQMGYENNKKHSNLQGGSSSATTNGKHSQKEKNANCFQNALKSTNENKSKDPQKVMSVEKQAESENQNQVPVQMYSQMGTNMKIQNELKKNNVLRDSNQDFHNNSSVQPSKIALSQSPKPQSSGRQASTKMNPTYEMLINSQQALEFLNQVENNRNSQPPLQYNSNHSSQNQDRKTITILGEKKKHSLNQQNNNIKLKQQKVANNNHQKSQSLFNKKIVDIISGLQQSLGVIANNVKHSFNNEDLNQLVLNNLTQGKNTSLVESAMLAQKLAQMTSQTKGGETQTTSITRQSAELKPKKHRKSSGSRVKEQNSQTAGVQKGLKTIEDSTEIMNAIQSVSNRPSMEGGKQFGLKNISNQIHSRTKSDLQHCRKSGNQVQAKTAEVPYSHISNKLNVLASSQQISDNNSQGQGGIMNLGNYQLAKSIEEPLINSNAEVRSSQYLHNNINALWQQHPVSTKHHKKSKAEKSNSQSNNNDSNRFKKKSTNSSKGNAVLQNQRGSISSKLSNKLSCERLSDANVIAKLSKKANNLLISNTSNAGYSVEHRLKSAASSPTLHSNIINNGVGNKQSLHVKKKDKRSGAQSKQVFDFGQASQAFSQKVLHKKKPSESQQQLNQNHNQNSLSSHKRSISDGTSLTKMFHFKQQMMLNKLINKGNSNQASTQNSMQENALGFNNHLALSKGGQSINQLQNKHPLMSNLSSKRPSNETGAGTMKISEHNYNSPRQQLSHNSNSRLSSASQRDIYTEMKNFLSKFQQTNKPQGQKQQLPGQQILSLASQNISSQQNLKNSQMQIIQSLCNSQQNIDQLKTNNNQMQSYGVTRSTTNTTLSNGSNMPGSIRQSNQHQAKAQGQYLIQQQPNIQYQVLPQNQDFSSQQQLSNRYSGNQHKRAKSDYHQQLDFLKAGALNMGKQPEQVEKTRKSSSKESKRFEQKQQPIISNNPQKQQKLFILNMNQQQQQQQQPQVRESMNSQDYTKLQILSQTPMIYSARASPSSKHIYCNFEELQESKRLGQQMQLNTNRSDKQQTSKFTCPTKLVFTSNQTTQRKQHSLQRECSPTDFETPQFNYAQEGHQQQQQLLPPKINNLIYYDVVPKSDNPTNFKNKGEKAIGNRNLMIKSSNFSSNGADSSESLYYQQQELLSSQGLDKKNYMHQSPQLKVLPTPKAVQPGIANGIPQQSLLVLQTNMTHHSLQSLENIKAQSSNLFSSKDSLDRSVTNKVMLPPIVQQTKCQNERIETFESNTNKWDHLSPRSKEKQRIIKLIRVSFNKLKEAPKTTSEFYRIGKMLGKGAFGRVNLAIHKLTEHLVAVKSINKQFLSEDESSKKKVMQEFLILQKTRQQNIVKLFDSFETNKHIVFVMELCAGGDLLNYVRKRRKLKEDLARYIFKQVVDGLEYCHAKGIVHRDIKLDNLLLDSSGQVKICDFGVSKVIEDIKKEVMTEQCGTPAYIAPEILKDKGYRGFGVDIWSLGVCLYAMLYGTVPFKANNMSELHQLIIKAKYSLKDDKVEVSDSAKSLIKALLEPDPSKRLNIKQVKQHQWLKELDLTESIEIFSEEEKKTIIKDFSYQDMKRYQRNQEKEYGNQEEEQEINGEQNQITTEHFFTEHALDSTQNALLKNCTTKSLVLAPFNSTRSHMAQNLNDSQGEPILPPLNIAEHLILDRRIIKFAARVKDINRQYEMNNNCELDNGVYNKFVRQSTQKEGANNEGTLKNDGLSPNAHIDDEDDSLVSSMNNQQFNKFKGKGEGPLAPLVSQNSDDEVEAELKYQKLQGNSELQQIQSFLQTHQSIPQIEEQQLLLDYDTVEKVEEFGYPREFVLQSLDQFDMNDATTCYFLLEKEKLVNGFSLLEKAI